MGFGQISDCWGGVKGGIVKRTPRACEVGFENGLVLTAGPKAGKTPFLVFPVHIPWFEKVSPGKDPIHVLSLGLAFMSDIVMTVDCDSRNIWVEDEDDYKI